MSVFHDEVEIEDFEYDEDEETYYYPCPCGDRFQITKVLPIITYPTCGCFLLNSCILDLIVMPYFHLLLCDSLNNFMYFYALCS